jgi:hypothetical protein
MKHLPTYLFITLALILGPSACGLFQSCPEALPYFQIELMEMNHYRFNDDPYGDPLVENAKVPWQEYGIKTDFKSTYYGANQETPGGAYLYALSCVEDGYMGTEVGVDTLYLVTLGDYNQEYLAKDTLNNILEITDYFNGSSFYSLTDYLNDNSESIRSESLAIKLTEGPSQDVGIEFELVYVLTSGEEFKQKTTVVNIRQ